MVTNILEYLEQAAARTPDALAVSGLPGPLTFRELSFQARSIGSCLLSHGVTKAPVAVLIPPGPEATAAFLGAIYAGCYYVPLDRGMPRSQLRQVLKQLDPGFLLCSSATEALARSLPVPGPVIPYDRAVSYQPDDAALRHIRRQQLDTDPICIIFSIQPPETPQGVMGCHRVVVDHLEASHVAASGGQVPLFFGP